MAKTSFYEDASAVAAVEGDETYVASFNGRTGIVVLTSADVTGVLNLRQQLTADTTFNVPSTYSTIQAAVDHIARNVDLAGYTATIQLAAGTYAGFYVATPWVGNGRVVLSGNTGSSTSYIVNSTITIGGTAANVIPVRGCQLDLSGIKITTTAGQGVQCQDGCEAVIVGKCTLDAIATQRLNITRGSGLIIAADLDVTGAAANFINLNQNSTLTTIGNHTFTFTNTSHSAGTIQLQRKSTAVVSKNSITINTGGSNTGTRYIVNDSSLDTAGGGANYFPGDVAGTTPNAGLYS